MEFQIDKKAMLDTLTICLSVAEKKNTMPILSHVLIEAAQGQVALLATDLEIAVKQRLEAKVQSTGKLTMQVRSLYDIVRESSTDQLTFAAKASDRMVIHSGKSRFEVHALAADEFPQLPPVTTPAIPIAASQWLDMIEKTQFAVSLDETRPYLSSILVEKRGQGKLAMIATDGHRLALVEEEMEKFPENKRLLIPRKGVVEMRKILDPEADFEFSIGDKNLLIRQKNTELTVRQVAGEYPDYEKVIPKNPKHAAAIDREALIGALRRVSLLANEKSRGVCFDFSPGHLLVSSQNPDLGSAQEELTSEYREEVTKIGFNARYFLDVLAVLQDEKVTLQFNDPLSPCLIRSEENRGFLAVVMPMRI